MLVWYDSYSEKRDRSKYVCNGCRITFDAAGLWSLGIEFSGNAVVGVINSLSSNDDNTKIIF